MIAQHRLETFQRVFRYKYRNFFVDMNEVGQLERSLEVELFFFAEGGQWPMSKRVTAAKPSNFRQPRL